MLSHQTTVSVAASDLLRISMAALDKIDYAKMYEIAETVARNPALLDDFKANPEAAAKKINGFQGPPGFHMHIVDSSNTYYPAEADALSQVSSQKTNATWSRIEVRAGYETIACVICFWCS